MQQHPRASPMIPPAVRSRPCHPHTNSALNISSCPQAIAEGALLSAVAQNIRTPLLTVCIAGETLLIPVPSVTVASAGFNTGHSTIVWLESSTVGRVIVFDSFDHQYQLGLSQHTL